MKKLLLVSLLAGCSAWKPSPMRSDEPGLRRGWSYIESEKEFLNQEAGVPQVSYSSAQIDAEKIVFGSDRFGLTVLSKRNGQKIWQKKIKDGVSCQPLVAQNSIFAGTDGGILHKFDLSSGKEIWQVDLGAPASGSLVLSGERLFVATADEALRAIDPSTGKIIWTYRRPAFSGTSIRGGGNPSIIADRLWSGFSDGSLVALNPMDGSVVYEKQYRDNIKFTDIDARILGWREGILVTTYDGKLRYLKKDGSLIWEFPAGGARAPVVADADIIYLPSTDGNVYAISSSGKQVWSYALRRGVPTSIAVMQGAKGRVLLVGGSEQKLFALDAVSGKLLAQSDFGRNSGTFSPIAIDQETKSFFVLSSFSRIYQFYLNL